MNQLIFKSSNRLLHRAGTALSPILLVAIRLYWGLSLAFIGYEKWMNLSKVAYFFDSLGFPLPSVTAAFVGGVEIVAGVALAIGLFSRFFGLTLTILFAVAYWTAHQEALSALFTDPSQFTTASPFLYLLTALIVFCFGPGLFSIDFLLQQGENKNL